MIPVLTFFVLQCTLCLTIRVPVEWTNNSEVKKTELPEQNDLPIETSPTQNVHKNQKPIPNEYFEYTAKKPQFAVDIATFHGVKSPQNHYKAYPVRPYTGVKKPGFGKHKIFDNRNHVYAPYRQFVKNNDHLGYVTPVSNNYNIYHPYKAEEPALKAIYQDPVLDKIREDLINNKNRLQKYENNAGEPNIKEGEYLESPDETDRKKFPHKNIPTQFEIHRPQRRPVYYVPPITYNRDHILNKKIRHPWGQNYAKITPLHYRPIKKELQKLRQQHAMKFDDENNEYPQIQPSPTYEEKPDGYDIYEKGREKFSQLRNNVDESINNAVKENHSSGNHQNLELQNTEDGNENTDEDEYFSPVKNYAQVRKIETIRHLPRDAAFHDAETYDDLRNAPRLREAIKSSKAQTVYSEEGYEDTAYDHAGEHKHASDHEGHGGYLKEKESSQGKYKIPSFTGNYEDAKGESYKDSIVHGEKWKNKDKDNKEENQSDDYSEGEKDYSIESDFNNDANTEETKENLKAVMPTKSDDLEHANTQHDLNKREAKLVVPEIDYSSTYLNEADILNISRYKLQKDKDKNLSAKYPYYKKSDKVINKDSPLRYAENLKNIPKKTNGGTEFYDSRTQYVCPDVDDAVDPVPEKIKKGGHPDENSDKENDEFHNMDDNPRLRGLGDKIDCFKAKYFGENPLDSPFFEEDLIPNPEPVTEPILDKLMSFNKYSNLSVSPLSILDSKQDKNVLRNHVNDMSEYRTNNDLSVMINTKNSDMTKPVDKELVKFRKKRASSFIYEPYKIIRDSQIQDSKKTTTTSNVSPLIKQLQSSRVVERVATNLNKDQPVKRNTGSLIYKNIGKKDREKGQDIQKEIINSTFIDVNEGSRLTEPSYEHRPVNHKPNYKPVQNKTYTSHEDFKNKSKDENSSINKSFLKQAKHTPRQLLGGDRNFFDVTKYLPESLELQKPQASNKIKNVMQRELEPKEEILSESRESKESDEEYEEYEDEEEEEVPLTTTTTTTTTKPPRRRRIRIMTTTKRPEIGEHKEDTGSKLRLVTRFRQPITTTQKPKKLYEIPLQIKRKIIRDDDISVPIYREKKKETSKSTIVTDTKSYEEGDDDSKKEDIDKLIGVTHNMDEYIPNYEQEEEEKMKLLEKTKISIDSKDEHLKNKENSGIDEDVDHGDNEDDDGDDDDDDGDKNKGNKDHYNDEGENDDDDDDDVSVEGDDESIESTEDQRDITTPETIQHTLPRTTDAPRITTAGYKLKPIISKKKIEIHQELPNRNNLTQFKQDIKEIEIIKEIPKKISHPSAEVLQLYKDENLAKAVNKIFDVEVFQDDIDLERGPRHGGNYKQIEEDDKKHSEQPDIDVSKKDTVPSESESAKLTKLNPPRIRNRENIRPKNIVQQTRRNRGQRAKLDDTRHPLSTTSIQAKYGGMLTAKDTPEEKNAKLIELSEDNVDNEEETESMHGGNFKAYSDKRNNGNSMHGGNYRSARITKPKESSETTSQNINERAGETKNMRRSSAALLDGFARAVPILTTTPAYILDPSKRMYYYVDS